MSLVETRETKFGRPIPVTQCNTAQDVRDLAARTRENKRAGYIRSPSFGSITSELEALRTERDFIKNERDQYRALSESLKESNDRLAREVNDLRIALKFVPPDVPKDPKTISRSVPIDKIINIVCGYFQVSKIQMLGKVRCMVVVHPRHVAMYLAVEYSGKSLPTVGRLFGGRDHSTVHHAHEKIKALRAKNLQIDADITRILARLSNTFTAVSSVASQSNPETAAPNATP